MTRNLKKAPQLLRWLNFTSTRPWSRMQPEKSERACCLGSTLRVSSWSLVNSLATKRIYSCLASSLDLSVRCRNTNRSLHCGLASCRASCRGGDSLLVYGHSFNKATHILLFATTHHSLHEHTAGRPPFASTQVIHDFVSAQVVMLNHCRVGEPVSERHALNAVHKDNVLVFDNQVVDVRTRCLVYGVEVLWKHPQPVGPHRVIRRDSQPFWKL
mmetsp:Transcript_36263/g.94999  ORF Transcript_36263/g.94999 Transcript_36263/m.94999 type:complete len:214 (+) Transcript_36263:3900-4541(+)